MISECILNSNVRDYVQICRRVPPDCFKVRVAYFRTGYIILRVSVNPFRRPKFKLLHNPTMRNLLLGLSLFLSSTLFTPVFAGLPDHKIYGVNLGSWWVHLNSVFRWTLEPVGGIGLCSSLGCSHKVCAPVALSPSLVLTVFRMVEHGWGIMCKLCRLH
jgi:hypothetical protein